MLVVPYLNPANHAPGIQVGNALEVICSNKLVIKEKKDKKKKSSENMRPLFSH